MQKGWIKALALALVFIVSLLVFGGMMNHTNEDRTTEMQEAVLPVIDLHAGNMQINELHGYAAEMNAAYMRDTITPVSAERILPVTIQTYQTKVDAISYEIRSLDAQRLIANADVTSYHEKKGKITANLTIQNLLEAGEEYLLIIRLTSGENTISYYTRIVEPVDCYVEECLAFVKDFNDKTFQDETVATLATYMERTTGDNSTLHFVSLNSSLKQVGWGDMNVERLTDPVPSVKEITSTYNVIVLSYVVMADGENGETDYYNIEEYYRVRYTSSRIYLLNFERRMNEIFRGQNSTVGDQHIRLGIRKREVEFKANEAGTSVAFVQEGELWSYNSSENTMAKVFSFRGHEGIDNRENYGEHDIRIVRIDEAGSADYIVYGYMNRGGHEGQVGMAVYHYDSISNTNEELAFIPSDKSYEVLKSELGQLMYVNEGGELFLMMDGTVYGIGLNSLKTREIVKGLSDEAFAVSSSNRLVAWVETEQISASGSIHILNLSDQKQTDITEGSGEYMKPLGFMEEDFIYGIAKAGDVHPDAAGNTLFPMYRIRISDVSSGGQEILKTYEKSGYYVSDIEIDGDTMYLNRIRYNGTAYVEADRDMIMNREGEAGRPVTVSMAGSGEKETQVRLMLPDLTSERAPKVLTPRETIPEADRTLSLHDESSLARYYVYVKGDVVFTTDHVTEAVMEANAKMGVVIGDDMKYVWKRARKAAQGPFRDIAVGAEDASAGSIARCINAMLEKEGINISVGALIDGGETPKSILNNMMKDMQVLDLTGCGLEETLYYVSCGSTVFAMTGGSQAVLIVGYDAGGVYIFDPADQTTRKETIADLNEIFTNAGNIFFTYLKA